MILRLLIIVLALPAIAMCEDNDMPNSIKDVKTQHEERLLQLPGVVSVGIGQDENGNPAIIVSLAHPDTDTESQLPNLLEGYPVLVQIVGRIKAQ
jgi:hypothetical protein